MKKKTSVFIIVALCLVLCACSSEKEEQTESSKALSAFSSFPENIPEFSTMNLEGEEVTKDIFSNADITVVNIWATYCNPCVDELSELAEWEKSMPDNVQLVGLMMDVTSEECGEYETAKQIVNMTGVKYPNLILTKDFEELVGGVVGVPTTIFVDKDGNIIDEPIVGADVDGYKKFVEEYLNE